MTQWIESLMNYPGIVFLMFLENVFPPIPSELVMPLAGFKSRSADGGVVLWGVILAGMIGSVLGQLPLYYLGKVIGEDKLAEWADKHGAWLTISGDEIHNSVKWFNEHGHKAVVFARVVPGVRSLISIPAGITKMNLGQFLLYSAIGTGVWSGALAYIGWLLGKRYDIVSKYMGPVTYIILGGIALYIVFNVVKRKRQQKDKDGGEKQADTETHGKNAAMDSH